MLKCKKIINVIIKSLPTGPTIKYVYIYIYIYIYMYIMYITITSIHTFFLTLRNSGSNLQLGQYHLPFEAVIFKSFMHIKNMHVLYEDEVSCQMKV